MIRRLRCLNALLLFSLFAICYIIWKRDRDSSSALRLLRTASEKSPFSLPKALLGFSPLKSGPYLGVGTSNLFSPDRNATITLELPPVKALPAPPLPRLAGVILMPGGAPTLLLSRSESKKHAYTNGDLVGDWRIVSFTRREVVLEWQGNRVTKPLAELIERTAIKGKTPPVLREPIAPTRAQQQPAEN